MGWFSRFSKSGPSEPGVASVRSVTFDTTGLRVESRSPDRVEWRSLWGEPIVVTLTRDQPGPGPGVLDLDHLRARHRADAVQRGGGLVSADAVRAAGHSAVAVVTKFRDGMGYAYEGALEVPLRGAWWTLTRSFREQGTTGVREAVITGHLFNQGLLQPPIGTGVEGPQRLEGFFVDPYDASCDDTALCSLCDDERFDALMPQHPLTLAREWLREVAGTLTVEESVQLVPAPDVLAPSRTSRVTGRVPASAVGMLYLMGRKMETAEVWLARAVSEKDGEPAVQDVKTAQTLVLLGLARENQGKLADADRAFTRAREMFEALAGDRDIMTVRAASHQARVWSALGRHEDAARTLEAALSVLKERGTDSEVAVALNDLGNAHIAAGRHPAAIPLFEEALARFELAEKETGKPIPDRATVLNNLARAFDATGARREAADARARARRIPQA